MGYDNSNTGVLFKNDKKGNENAPDYRGNINITPDMVGKELNLSAWINTSAKGTKYMGLKVSEQQPQQQSQQPQQTSSEPPPF